MKDAYAKANNNSNKAANAGKRIYDSKVRYIDLKAGGRVLVRNLCERGGPEKLRSHWESQIREVVEQKEGLLIFVVKPEGKAKGRSEFCTETCFSRVTSYHLMVSQIVNEVRQRRRKWQRLSRRTGIE